MKTREDIIHALRNRTNERLFDFFPEVVSEYLTFDQAIEFFEFKDVEESKAKWEVKLLDETGIKKDMREYMKFAWEKAESHRGLSASRSVQKMEAWCWLLDVESKVDWENYAQYGAPILAQVCGLFDFSIPQNATVTNMINGDPCEVGCELGCEG